MQRPVEVRAAADEQLLELRRVFLSRAFPYDRQELVAVVARLFLGDQLHLGRRRWRLGWRHALGQQRGEGLVQLVEPVAQLGVGAGRLLVATLERAKPLLQGLTIVRRRSRRGWISCRRRWLLSVTR